MEKKQYKYFRNTQNGKVYRTGTVKYNTGETGISLERYSFDFNNWNGHIHDHDTTRRDIELFVNIEEITDAEALTIINR